MMISALGCMAESCPDPQANDAMMKEMIDFKMKFIAQEIGLKENQLQKFYDVYARQEAERHKCFTAVRKADKKVRDEKNCTESDFETCNKANLDFKCRDAAIEKQYYAEYSKFMTQKQISKMRKAEFKFRDKMQKMKKKRKNEKK